MAHPASTSVVATAMATPVDAAAATSSGIAPAASSASSAAVELDAAADPTGRLSYPQWDGTAMGLPEGFILYSYNRLKG